MSGIVALKLAKLLPRRFNCMTRTQRNKSADVVTITMF